MINDPQFLERMYETDFLWHLQQKARSDNFIINIGSYICLHPPAVVNCSSLWDS